MRGSEIGRAVHDHERRVGWDYFTWPSTTIPGWPSCGRSPTRAADLRPLRGRRRRFLRCPLGDHRRVMTDNALSHRRSKDFKSELVLTRSSAHI